MKYACLVYAEPAATDALSPEEGIQLTDDSLDYDRRLAADGHMIAAQALQSVESAVTIRVRNGKASSTDGPFAETKEHLAGFILIEARDLNEAIRVATGIPMARVGSIEVRPILQLEHSQRGQG
jgi:hypothetical protein